MRSFGLTAFLAAAASAHSSDPARPVRFPNIAKAPDYNIGAAPSATVTLGNITGIAAEDNGVRVSCGADQLRIQFYRADVVRVWLGWGGAFTDDVSEDIVVGAPITAGSAWYRDAGEYFDIRASASSSVSLRAHKIPMRLELFRGMDRVWSESVGLSRNTSATFQTLASADKEQFFGGGMQNGRFSHKGHRVRVSTDGNWADGGNPNAAPFWVSSSGYGVYRNTWSPGFYDFSASPTVFAHNESRFDAFYFVAAEPRGFRAVLEGYTFLTGRPFMPPVYALGLGDSDCYHNDRHGNSTHTVIALADKYRELDMPGSWFLPNDGYGCGFGEGPEKFPCDFAVLDDVVAELHKRGFQTGLWSSTGLPNITREVAGSGVRIGKTDVGWIGSGYKYAFDSVKQVARGIEDNSDGRRFIWTVEGWAGTQRLAVMWTGDDSGSFEYLRWQIPTFVGCGFSAQAHVSGDIDGIFGGSPETYVRDLQFKSMMTVWMTMSGWASNPDKQPWTWGEPYTSINRMYMKLKLRLTPYFYSLSREAYDTGFPPIRALTLEFPEDDATLVNSTGTAQQFMAGPWFLVAPVYRPLSAGGAVRDGIYLPKGAWVDYWSRGSIMEGPKTLDGYQAPLEKLPMFVRAGAIVPMWPDMRYAGELPADPLTLGVFPAGETYFRLYEDDGLSREALGAGAKAFSWTNISCSAGPDALRRGGRVAVTIGASVGDFKGKLSARSYHIHIHTRVAPGGVLLTGASGRRQPLPEKGSLAQLEYAEEGWFFTKTPDGERAGGVVIVKTKALSTSEAFTVELPGGPTHVGTQPCSDGAASKQSFDFAAKPGLITLRSNGSLCVTVGSDKDPYSQTAALEVSECSPSAKAQQEWNLTAAGNLQLSADPAHCVDLDHEDRMAEMYSCYSPATPNQRWLYDVASGRLTSSLDGSCLTVAVQGAARHTPEVELGIFV